MQPSRRGRPVLFFGADSVDGRFKLVQLEGPCSAEDTYLSIRTLTPSVFAHLPARDRRGVLRVDAALVRLFPPESAAAVRQAARRRAAQNHARSAQCVRSCPGYSIRIWRPLGAPASRRASMPPRCGPVSLTSQRRHCLWASGAWLLAAPGCLPGARRLADLAAQSACLCGGWALLIPAGQIHWC